MSILSVEYGNDILELDVPYPIDIIGMKPAPEAILFPDALNTALAEPIGSKPFMTLAKEKKNFFPDKPAVIVVSDNTRPTPYKGESGLLAPLLTSLMNAGYKEQEIIILIGNGSHRDMTQSEIENMLGLESMGFFSVKVMNHRYDQKDHLKHIGKTKAGTEVFINSTYLDAGFKIVTGLIESHFMAGVSGGAKGICPAIVGKASLENFHSAHLLSSQYARDLEVTFNPVQGETREIAAMAGCDFLINVTLDGKKQVTGIFCGDLIQAHEAGIGFIRSYVCFPIPKLYDIVLIPGGFVGINHYQTAKAAVIASYAVQPGGYIIIAAKNTDLDPTGGASYKNVLKYLAQTGYKKFMEDIQQPRWKFQQEQWQVQLWCKALEKISGKEHLIYCSLDIAEEDYSWLPCIPPANTQEKSKRSIQTLICDALEYSVIQFKEKNNRNPDILFLQDGPYGIPQLEIPP